LLSQGGLEKTSTQKASFGQIRRAVSPKYNDELGDISPMNERRAFAGAVARDVVDEVFPSAPINKHTPKIGAGSQKTEPAS